MQELTTVKRLTVGFISFTCCLALGSAKAPAGATISSGAPGRVFARVMDSRLRPTAARKTRGATRAGRARRAQAEQPSADELSLLRQQIAVQQEQINQLRARMEELGQRMGQTEQFPQGGPSPMGGRREVASRAPSGDPASLSPEIPLSLDRARFAASAPAASGSTPVTQAELQSYSTRVDDLGKKTETVLKNLGGFQFGGDFRLRADVQARSGNAIAPPLQNARARYRLRLNVDKEWDKRFKFHLQLSTGPLNNALTADQDFAGTVAKSPFSIAEAYVDFHPNPNFSARGGRMEEVFMDYLRFLWDDDVRFNGFQQVATVPFGSKPWGFKSLEFRTGEYLLSNPNVPLLAASSPFVGAGFQAGQKVRDANLFHPGLVLRGDLGTRWSHRLSGDVELYRNASQIQLASTTAGFPVVVSNALGVALAGPMSGTGNATTTPGGARYSARNFQIARVVYRLEHSGWKFRDRPMPAWLDFQAARNFGTGKLRDAFLASANLGEVKGFGDVRFLYQFGIKDANSLVSQFTDDDFGTATGVNISTHAVRFDFGLTRFLQWQNLFFIQDARRPSNPAEQFFVPVQRGAGTTFRYLGQFNFTF